MSTPYPPARPHEKFLPNPKLKLRAQLAEVCRFRHLSHRTENAYWSWIRDYLRFHRRPVTAMSRSAEGERGNDGWRHPRELGAAAVRDYLSYLAVERKVAAATQRQALNGIVFLYQEVLGMELGEIGRLERPTRKVNVPTVLSQEEMRRVLAALGSECGLIGRLLYGTGLRLLECLRLRVHPVR